ncbi:MAG: hypothetical protein U0800_09690 [Isosphaeraceae bacterium]
MMELHRRFGHLAELPDGDGDAAEYSRRKGGAGAVAGEADEVDRRAPGAAHPGGAEARRDLEEEDARPMDAADFLDESPEAKNLRRYRAEALRVSPAPPGPGGVPTRNHREYERIVYRERHNIEPTCRFGPFLIWMPLWLRRLAPADQILSIIRELEADLPNNLRPTRDEAIRWHASGIASTSKSLGRMPRRRERNGSRRPTPPGAIRRARRVRSRIHRPPDRPQGARQDRQSRPRRPPEIEGGDRGTLP